MRDLENIYERFKVENPNLESVREASAKLSRFAKGTILLYSMIAFISIPFGNGFTVGIFLGLIPFLVFMHLLTKKRTNFEQKIESIQPRYLELLSQAQPFNISYLPEADTQIARQSLFFSSKLDPFAIECSHQIKIEDDTYNLLALNVDFRHVTKKNRSVDFYWKKSLLICLDYSTGLLGKNLLIPASYFHSSSEEDGSRQFNRVMPLKKLNYNTSAIFEGYALFTDNDKKKIELDSGAHVRVQSILTDFFKGKQKFVSITENNIYVLIFNTTIFKSNVKKSIYKHNIFSDYQNEMKELHSITKMMNSKS